MTDRYDVVVVGAGPAGSSAAYHAARAGLDVVLIDRQTAHRDKTCGDGLLPHAAHELARLGLSDWLGAGHHGRFDGFSVYARTARFRQPIPANPNGKFGYVVRREETDAKLLQRARHAGADFRPSTAATELLRTADGSVAGVAVRTRTGGGFCSGAYEAPLVIVADGVGGFAARLGKRRMKPEQNAIALRQYFAGVEGSYENHTHVWLTERMMEVGVGYGWIFYFGDGSANVGVGLYTRNLAHPGLELPEIYEAFLEEPEVRERLRNAKPEGPTKRWSLKTGMPAARTSAAGVMYAGDAAGMIHPISGEGVGYALESGRLAAYWAFEAHRRGDFSRTVLRGYDRFLRSVRLRGHRSALALVWAINRYPHLDILEPLLRICAEQPAVRQTVMECFAGDRSVDELLVRHPRAAARAAGTVAAGIPTAIARGPKNGRNGR